MTGATWYCAKDGATLGPFDLPRLRQMVASGTVGRSDLVWQEGTSDWVAAGTVPGLFSAPPPVPGAARVSVLCAGCGARPTVAAALCRECADLPGTRTGQEIATPPERMSGTALTEPAPALRPGDAAQGRGDVGKVAGAVAVGVAVSVGVWSLLIWGARALGAHAHWFPDVPLMWQLIVPPLAAVGGGYAAGRATHRGTGAPPPVLAANLALPFAAAAVALLGVAVVVVGGCGWYLSGEWCGSPLWRVVCTPLFGAMIGGLLGVVGLVIRAANDPKTPPATTGENVRFVLASFTHDPWDDVRVVARKLLGDALAPGYAATVLLACMLVGAANAALIGFVGLIGEFWPVLGWTAALVAMVAATAAAEWTVREAVEPSAAPVDPANQTATPGLSAREVYALAATVAAILLAWSLVVVPYAILAPDAFRRPTAAVPTASAEAAPKPAVPTKEAEFAAADGEFVRRELYRREVGQVLLKAARPGARYTYSAPPTLTPSADRRALTGRVTASWTGAFGASHHTTFAFTLTTETAVLTVESDTGLTEIARSDLRRAQSELDALNRVIQADRHRNGSTSAPVP